MVWRTASIQPVRGALEKSTVRLTKYTLYTAPDNHSLGEKILESEDQGHLLKGVHVRIHRAALV